jgi:hypothetical protein
MYILAATIFATGIIQHWYLLRLRTVCNIIRNLCAFFWIITFPMFFGRFQHFATLLPVVATFSPTFCNLLPVILQTLSPHFATFFPPYFNLLPNILQPSFHCFATFSLVFCNFFPRYCNLLPCVLQPSSHRKTIFFLAFCNLFSIVWQPSS